MVPVCCRDTFHRNNLVKCWISQTLLLWFSGWVVETSYVAMVSKNVSCWSPRESLNILSSSNAFWTTLTVRLHSDVQPLFRLIFILRILWWDWKNSEKSLQPWLLFFPMIYGKNKFSFKTHLFSLFSLSSLSNEIIRGKKLALWLLREVIGWKHLAQF